jgi:hypothetical protein
MMSENQNGYGIKASSNGGNSHYLFDQEMLYNSYAWSSGNNYTYDGNYIGESSLKIYDNGEIKGEWISILMPDKVEILYYELTANPYTTYRERCPYDSPNTWFFVGRNSGDRWSLLDSQTANFDCEKSDIFDITLKFKVKNPGLYKEYAFLFTVVGNPSQQKIQYNKALSRCSLFAINLYKKNI